MTYSILACDPEAGEIGVAVQSHYFGVGSLVPWARPGVGVVATQSVVRAAYGPDLLDRLARGEHPATALDELVRADRGAPLRQVAVLDVAARGATHTGAACIAAAGHAAAEGVRAQANLVTGPRVWEGMLESYRQTRGSLAERLLSALDAAQAAGGDLRGQQAAAVTVVRTVATGDLAADTVLDIRVDDHPTPLAELRRLAGAASALAGLVGMLEEPGLLSGAMTAAREVVESALADLDRAERILGDGNGEPAAWAGLLLARTGRLDEARACFRRSRAAGPVVPLLASLAEAGMWTGEPATLLSLAEDDAAI